MALALSTALFMAACAAQNIEAVAQPAEPEPIASPVPTPSPTPIPIVDLDGDGLADSVSVEDAWDVENDDDAHSTIAVSLGNGNTLEHTVSGRWWADAPQFGDLDGDGSDDILLFLEIAGSNYGNGRAVALRVTGSELKEFPYDIARNDSLPFTQERYARFGTREGDGEINLVGALLTPLDGGLGIRLQEPIDVTGSADPPTAWYIDIAWQDSCWKIVNLQVGLAYANEALPTGDPIEQLTPEIPTAHRAGYVAPEITYVDCDPDVGGFDLETSSLLPTIRSAAEAALVQLYDMTGITLDKVYAKGGPFGVSFNMQNKNWGGRTFFSARFDSSGCCFDMSLAIKQPRVSYSPLDPEKMIKPENVEAMTKPEIAKWYYEHSTYGGRQAIVRAEEGPYENMVRLYIAGERFYEAWFGGYDYMPDMWYGPYEAGFEH